MMGFYLVVMVLRVTEWIMALTVWSELLKYDMGRF